MFLNLLYKSLKADVVLRRVKAFVKRLLQVSAEQNASFVCGALFLVSELMKAKPGLKLLLQEGGVRRKTRLLFLPVSPFGRRLAFFKIILLRKASVFILLLSGRGG